MAVCGRKIVGPVAHVVAVLVLAQALAAATAAANPSDPPYPIEIRLPADAVYDRTVGPDSAVTFRHATHVALAGNRCTGCHPQLFQILVPTRAISHSQMDAGRSCGTCHDGRSAFGVRDRQSCASCHAGRRTARMAASDSVAESAGRPARFRGPKPILYLRSPASPGGVTFRHATHVVGTAGCVTCHPRPFAMKSSGPLSDGAMHGPSACGACHDGRKAFDVGDAKACERCHAGRRGAP